MVLNVVVFVLQKSKSELSMTIDTSSHVILSQFQSEGIIMNKKTITQYYCLWVVMAMSGIFVWAQDETPKPGEDYVITGVIRDDFIGSESMKEEEMRHVIELPWPEQKPLEELDPKIREFFTEKTHTQQDERDKLIQHHQELDARTRGVEQRAFSQEPQEKPKLVFSGFKPLKNSELREIGFHLQNWQRSYDFTLGQLVRRLGSLATDSKSDLQKLEWVIKTNKTTYAPGEPIGVSVSLRNISSEEVLVFYSPYIVSHGFFLNSMQVRRKVGDNYFDVFFTSESFRMYPKVAFSGGKNVARENILQPGEMAKVCLPFNTLNRYYDLSLAGEYELMFYTRDFVADDEHQIDKSPAVSGKVYFTIKDHKNWLDEQVKWPDESEPSFRR